MSIHSSFHYGLVAAVSVWALCSAIVLGASEAPTPIEVAALKARMDQGKSLTSDDLRRVLTATGTEPVLLSDLWQDPAPHLWVSDIGCHGIFRLLWSAAGLSPSESSHGPITNAVSRVTSETAKAVLVLTADFQELSRRSDASIWDILTRRAALPPDIVDACILSAIMWGDKLPLLPDQATSQVEKPAFRSMVSTAWNTTAVAFSF